MEKAKQRRKERKTVRENKQIKEQRNSLKQCALVLNCLEHGFLQLLRDPILFMESKAASECSQL
jgi:hypothetical protein